MPLRGLICYVVELGKKKGKKKSRDFLYFKLAPTWYKFMPFELVSWYKIMHFETYEF